MTLQTILQNVEFHDLVDSLIRIDPKTADNLYCFKEAFDILRMMHPEPSDGVDISVYMHDYEDGNPPCLSAHSMHDNNWEVILSRNVIVDSKCQASNNDIAAILLWEITFWGFSPEEMSYGGAEADHAKNNPYLKQYLTLRQRDHDLNCRYKEDIGKETYSLKDESDFLWKPRRNGPKRHRQRRHELRLQELEKKVNRWDLCEQLIAEYKLSASTGEKLRTEIMEGTSFCHYHMQSRTLPGNESDYMVEQIRDYFPCLTGSKSIVLISAPARITGHGDFENTISSAFGSSRKIPVPQYIFTIDEGRDHIRIDLLVFE